METNGAHDVANIIIKYIEKINPSDKYMLFMYVDHHGRITTDLVTILNSVDECILYAKSMIVLSHNNKLHWRQNITIQKPNEQSITYKYYRINLLHEFMNKNNYFTYIGSRSEFKCSIPDNYHNYVYWIFMGFLIEKFVV
jgi:hypothetical protein